MEYSPPPLFKQGTSARVKMSVFACISIALLLVDSRMHSLDTLRLTAGTALYPLQMAALLPRDALAGVGEYFSSVAALEKQVRELKRQQIAMAQSLQQAQLHSVENNQLRKLMGARERLPVKSMLAEVLYDARDLNSRKIILDRGTQQGVTLGLPVIDNLGVVGQVTRVFPFTSEVTLLTDKEQAIPVELLRNGMRSVAYGRGKSGLLELRFIAPNADIAVGDVVVTSGLDGVYPAGLAVARVSQVENSAGGSFGGVTCQPLAGIGNNTQLLILMAQPDLPPRPPEDESRVPKKHTGKMGPLPTREGGGIVVTGTAAAAAPAAVAGAPAARAPAAAPAANPAATPAATSHGPAAAPAAAATTHAGPATAPAAAAATSPAPAAGAAAKPKETRP